MTRSSEEEAYLFLDSNPTAAFLVVLPSRPFVSLLPPRNCIFFCLYLEGKDPEQVKFFAWQILLGRTNTLDRVQRCSNLLVASNWCCLCKRALEDFGHIIWRCEFAQALWNWMLGSFGICWMRNKDCSSMMEGRFFLIVLYVRRVPLRLAFCHVAGHLAWEKWQNL